MILSGSEIAEINSGDLPCEIKPSVPIQSGSVIEFVDCNGRRHVHSLAELSGWAHISVRVHENLACQADCAVTESEAYDPYDLLAGNGFGVRFQPFFLPGSTGDPNDLIGQGLFRRGLHFSGTVTPGSVRLACECDHCAQSFLVQSFHAGFSNVGYMYSSSGSYTLIIDQNVPGAPPALGKPDYTELAKLEAELPLAPDGTRFQYMNSFNCPHCRQPYIDFQAHPQLREGEYYGNFHFGVAPLHYERPPASRGKGLRGWLNGRLTRN